MEIDIKEPLATEKRTTCFLYDPNVANNKVLDEATRLNMNTMTRKIEDDNINYNYTIYKSNGKGYSYDSLTGKVTNASNPPMTNKEGKILCKTCLNKYKTSDDKYIDPKTKKEYNISDWKLLYLS